MKLFRIGENKRELAPVPKRTMHSLQMTETSHLEDWILQQGGEPFERQLLWISRQDSVTNDQRSDLIGVDSEGNLIICELKRGKATEQAVIQALGYAAEYRHLDIDALSEVLYNHASRKHLGELSFESEMEARSHLNASIAKGSATTSTEVEVNQSQVVIIVAEEFHANMLSICDYLNNASNALNYWFECWQYELFTDDSDQGGTYLTFNQILPPINVRSEIAERRDAEKSRKYARDPDRIDLSQRLESSFHALEDYETSRNRGASYTFTVAFQDGSHSFSIRVGDDNPALIVPEELVSGESSSKSIDGAKLRQFGGEWGFIFEKFSSADPTRADELAGKMQSVVHKLVEAIQ